VVFWNHCLKCTFASFLDPAIRGRGDFSWWVERAIAKRLIRLDTLPAGSVALIVIECQSAGRLHQQAVDQFELSGRGFLPPEIDRATHAYRHPLHANFLAMLTRYRGRSEEDLCLDLVENHLGWDALRFLARIGCIEESVARIKSFDRIQFALREARGTVGDQLVDMIHQLVVSAPATEVDPMAWPIVPVPSWYLNADSNERAFLQASIDLSDRFRRLLWLSVYGRMTCRQISKALVGNGLPSWTTGAVADELSSAWNQLFRTVLFREEGAS